MLYVYALECCKYLKYFQANETEYIHNVANEQRALNQCVVNKAIPFRCFGSFLWAVVEFHADKVRYERYIEWKESEDEKGDREIEKTSE